MVKVRSWRTRDLATVVQAVQISADAQRVHAARAARLRPWPTRSWARRRAGVSCQFPKTTEPTALPALSTRLARELPVNAPSVTAKAITVPGAGWKTAAWFVANAQRAGLDTVDYDGWRWSRTSGWKAGHRCRATAVSATRKA